MGAAVAGTTDVFINYEIRKLEKKRRMSSSNNPLEKKLPMQDVKESADENALLYMNTAKEEPVCPTCQVYLYLKVFNWEN